MRTRGEGGFWNADVHISTFSATENRRLFYSVFGFPGQSEPRIKRTFLCPHGQGGGGGGLVIADMGEGGQFFAILCGRLL